MLKEIAKADPSLLPVLQAIRQADPRHLEMIVNKPPPFGNHVRDSARQMPAFRLEVVKEPDLEWGRTHLGIKVYQLDHIFHLHNF